MWLLRRLSVFEHAKHFFHRPFNATGLGVPPTFTDRVMLIRLGLLALSACLGGMDGARNWAMGLTVYLLVEALQTSFFHNIWRWQTIAARDNPKQFVYSRVRTFVFAVLMFAHVVGLYAIIYAHGLASGVTSGGEHPKQLEGILQAIYFSVVTATTLGFGDFSPNTDFARVVVASEALAGLFMLAVVIARAVGILEPIQTASDRGLRTRVRGDYFRKRVGITSRDCRCRHLQSLTSSAPRGSRRRRRQCR